MSCLVVGETGPQRPYVQRELFALGSAIYEIMAWEMPFTGLSDEGVEEKYGREDFPDVAGLLAEDIIHCCWKEEFHTAEDVRTELLELRTSCTSKNAPLITP